MAFTIRSGPKAAGNKAVRRSLDEIQQHRRAPAPANPVLGVIVVQSSSERGDTPIKEWEVTGRVFSPRESQMPPSDFWTFLIDRPKDYAPYGLRRWTRNIGTGNVHSAVVFAIRSVLTELT
jgi:hypothetical protein